MTRAILLSLTAAAALLATASAQVAITEFINNPDGLDDEREFFELFNYGEATVNLRDWTISDEDPDDNLILTEADLFVPSGGYVVFAANKSLMESDYFSGVSQANIYQYDRTSFFLANDEDEAILRSAQGEIIWSLAYRNDDVRGAATFFTENSFTLTIWGSKATPGIDRDGIDPASDSLGYESNSATPDPNARETESGDTASPLLGNYTVGGGGGPTEPSFRIVEITATATPGTHSIVFESELGANYVLETSSDLSQGTFIVEAPVVGTGDLTTVITQPAQTPRQFYRIRRTGGVVIDP